MVAKRGLVAGLLVGLLTLAAPLSARQPPAAAADPQAEAEGAEGERRNEVGLVLAGTRERAEEETSFTIGAEYGRRFAGRFTLVGEFEYVSGPDSWVFAAPMAFRLVGGLRVFAGPGFERRPVEDEAETREPEPVAAAPTYENLFLWRVGTSYAWELSRRYVLGPSFYLDFVRQGDDEWTRAFVFGIAVGVAF